MLDLAHPEHIVLPLLGAVGVLLWRLGETIRPLHGKAIVLPPMGMATGSLMFFHEPMQVPWSWAVTALLCGSLLLSLPLIGTSDLYWKEDRIYLRRSRAFLWVLLGLLSFRFLLREELSLFITLKQSASLGYLLALGMIVTWRTWMYFRYQHLLQKRNTSERNR